jgi:hypothetical protein
VGAVVAVGGTAVASGALVASGTAVAAGALVGSGVAVGPQADSSIDATTRTIITLNKLERIVTSLLFFDRIGLISTGYSNRFSC